MKVSFRQECVREGIACRIGAGGLTATIEDLFGGTAFDPTCPGSYFRDARWPAKARLRLAVPACFHELALETARASLEAEVRRQVLEARAHVEAEGWSVMGAVAAKAAWPYREPKSWEELGARVPHIKAGRGQKQARLAAIERLQAFRMDHHQAKRRWCAGERDVVSPPALTGCASHHGPAVRPWSD